MPPGMNLRASGRAEARTSLTSSLMQTLGEIEARFPVAQWTVGQVHVWPLVRVRWCLGEWARHYAASGATGPVGKATSLALRLITGPAKAALASRRGGERVANGAKQRDLLFLSDGVSYARLGDRWLERFCDPVIRAAAARGLKSRLLAPGYAFHIPQTTPPRFIQPMLDRANLLGGLRAGTPGVEANLPGIDDLGAWVARQGFGMAWLQRSKVVSDGLRILAQACVHGRLLQMTKPRLAFVVSYYGIEGMSFVLACRRAGVPVVDLQHGAPGKLHPAYASLPRPAQDVHALVPDRFWVWSEWEQGVISDWASGTGHAAVVGGDPWMTIWEEDKRWEGLSEAMARAGRLLARAGGRPIVLITLQWGLNPDEQLEPMGRLIAASADRFEFWVRLHPSMLDRREEVRALLQTAGGRYELDEPTDLPLPALLSHASVHVTHSSSTAVEAAEFGVRTVLTSALGGELYARLAEGGWVVTECGDCEQVLAALKGLLAERPPGGTRRRRVRIEEALDELLKEAA